MRSLDRAGLAASPFCKASDVAGALLAITNAVSRDGRYGPEVVFSLRLLRDAFDRNGNAIPELFRISMDESPWRLDCVRAFEDSPEEIGPVILVQLPAQREGESGAWVFNDARGMIDGELVNGQAAIAAPTTAPADTLRTAPPEHVARNVVAPKARGGAGAASRSRQSSGPGSSVSDDDLEDLPF